MKPVSDSFKQIIGQYGREIDVIIEYNDGEEHSLNSDVLFSVTPTFNGNILKSVMKQVDFESSIKVPKNTIINLKFGIKVDSAYEYLNFGNYIVSEEPEYNADTFSYTHICYDKMLYSMQNYEKLDITYPITIREYISKICEHLGLTFKNVNEVFCNYDKTIKNDLYFGYDYTFRDIIDELAQVTASTICINEITDELEVRYLNTTQEIINEDYLKDINVEFGEKYGPINSIVLSRAGESDNVYLRDEQSIQNDGLCEIKIIDNQIMNDNDRSDFLPDILSTLNGINYFINDFNSTGICWLELCDKYTVKIQGMLYDCVLLNNEIKITQGLEESIYTEMPAVSETDYSKADKTDRRINQAYIIVDKQNQIIQSVVSQTDVQNQKISEVTQTVNELNSKIGDIADITTSKESTNAIVEFEKINQSEPIYVKIHPTGKNISYLYPRENLYPSNDLFMTVRTLRFTNTTTNEIFDYELPTDLLYYDASNYDEFILDYDALSCEVNKRVGYNADGTTYLLDAVKTIKYDFPRIELTDGDYKIELLGYSNAYLFVRLMAQNYYTTQFATKAEMNSEIKQTAEEIELSTDKKLSNYSTTTEMNAAISMKANEINSTVSETYSTKTETAAAKSEAIDIANTSTDTKLKNYSTTTQMNSAINQKADSITSTVTKQISNAKTEAINSANSSTDTKLKNYSTTTQMNSAIEQKANSITSTVASTYTTKTENVNTLNSAKSYTDTQVTSAKTEIKQTTDSISSTVSKKVGYNEIISKINQSAETVQINANKISLERKRD